MNWCKHNIKYVHAHLQYWLYHFHNICLISLKMNPPQSKWLGNTLLVTPCVLRCFSVRNCAKPLDNPYLIFFFSKCFSKFFLSLETVVHKNARRLAVSEIVYTFDKTHFLLQSAILFEHELKHLIGVYRWLCTEQLFHDSLIRQLQ